jgi:hypothetical protein
LTDDLSALGGSIWRGVLGGGECSGDSGGGIFDDHWPSGGNEKGGRGGKEKRKGREERLGRRSPKGTKGETRVLVRAEDGGGRAERTSSQ